MAKLQKASAGVSRMEELASADSPVHRLHPMAKLAVTLVFIVIVVSFPTRNAAGLAPFFFYPFIMTALSDTPLLPLLKRFLAALPFALMGALSVLIALRDTAFNIGSFAVTTGMIAFISIMLKSFLTVTAALILVAVTPFTELCYQLLLIRVPKIICLQLVMTYRYLSTLTGEALSMFTAYSLRSAGQKGIKMRDMGVFLGQLILRSFDRAERVYMAMKCRGFDGVFRGTKRAGLRKSDIAFMVFVLLAVTALRFFSLGDIIWRLAG